MISYGLYLAAFGLCFNLAYGIRCYSCDSSKNMACSFGLLSFTLPSVDCNEVSADGDILSRLGSLSSYVPAECMKLVGYDRHGNEYIARGCTVNTGPINTCDIMAKAMQFGQSQDIQKLDCWTCNTDQCNSATKFSAIGIVVGVIAACLAFLF